jgi:hypothetical protein
MKSRYSVEVAHFPANRCHTSARLDGVIPALKPLLDQLVASGFHLDPHGQVYQDAVRRVGEV